MLVVPAERAGEHRGGVQRRLWTVTRGQLELSIGVRPAEALGVPLRDPRPKQATETVGRLPTCPHDSAEASDQIERASPSIAVDLGRPPLERTAIQIAEQGRTCSFASAAGPAQIRQHSRHELVVTVLAASAPPFGLALLSSPRLGPPLNSRLGMDRLRR